MSKKILTYLLVIALITISGLPAFADNIYSIGFSLNKSGYTIDEYIAGSGTIYNNGTPLPNALVTMVVNSEDGKSMYDVDQYTTDSEGKFDVRFRMVESAGEGRYTISLKSYEIEKIVPFSIVKPHVPDDDTPSRPRDKKETEKSPIELGLIKIEGDIDSSLKAEILDEQEAEEIFNYLASAEYYPISNIFDITLSKELDKPLKLIIKYDTSKITDSQKLGVYYFNEGTNEWEYIGGKVVKEGEIQVTIDHLSKFAVVEYRKTFKDISNIAWAQNQIEVLAARHIINGVDNENYAPNNNITRAAFAKLIVEGLNLKAGSNEVKFGDVQAGSWYKESVDIAASLGLVVGYDGKFDPNGQITREQMAAIIVRAIEHVDPNGNYTAGVSSFTDQEQISTWAREAVEVAASKGLVQGVGNGLFEPQGKATRAQAAVIVYRMLDLLGEL